MYGLFTGHHSQTPLCIGSCVLTPLLNGTRFVITCSNRGSLTMWLLNPLVRWAVIHPDAKAFCCTQSAYSVFVVKSYCFRQLVRSKAFVPFRQPMSYGILTNSGRCLSTYRYSLTCPCSCHQVIGLR